ncbi:MAG TPA: PAS domain-containing sensor histidine kinase, partial [Cyanobacteria bacterium UBA12227]|nr:PAS domain-containing sensor histidine kinase [Cyanobacteria bacterium UBA12227]
HEINNPVSFIYGNLNYAEQYFQDLLELIKVYQQCCPNPAPKVQDQIQQIDLDFLTTDLPKLLHSMKVGADRIYQIVRSLRNFSHLDRAEKKPVNIHEGIDN